MAFPSPANDYVEKRLTPEGVMGITASSVVIQTTEGYAVAEPDIPAKMGKWYYWSYPAAWYLPKCAPGGKSLMMELSKEMSWTMPE